jgi:ribonuclease III
MEQKTIQSILAYNFNNQSLLNEAVTHTSFSNEANGTEEIPNYEKLEFLGDAVLELVITDMLLKYYPDKNEGELSRARALLVSEAVLSDIAKNIDLGSYLKLGKGELFTGGRKKDSILASSLEAIFGAIFLDSGIIDSQRVVQDFYREYIEKAFSAEFDMDYKTRLQELLHSRFKSAPLYELVEVEGPPHSRSFKIKLTACQSTAYGVGNSKKEAEQRAAKQALLELTEEK